MWKFSIDPLRLQNQLENSVSIDYLAETIKSGKKKEPKPKLVGTAIFGWGGGLPSEGLGAEKFGMSLETRETKLFWRDIPGFCQDIPEVPEKFEKKKFVFNFRSLSKRKRRIQNAFAASTPHRRYGHRLRTPFLQTLFPRLLLSRAPRCGSGVARGLLQERPLQLPMG